MYERSIMKAYFNTNTGVFLCVISTSVKHAKNYIEKHCDEKWIMDLSPEYYKGKLPDNAEVGYAIDARHSLY